MLPSGARCVSLSCVADAATGWLGAAEINALNFEITEGERPIEDYYLNWLSNDTPLTALLVLPRSWNGSGELLRPALLGAGDNENYGFLPYQTPYSPIRGNEQDDAVEVNFARYIEVSKNYLAHRYYVAKSLGFAIKAGITALGQPRGKKHIFVLADPSVGDAAAPAEFSSLDCQGTQIHAVVWDNARAEFCRVSARAIAAVGRPFCAGFLGSRIHAHNPFREGVPIRELRTVMETAQSEDEGASASCLP